MCVRRAGMGSEAGLEGDDRWNRRRGKDRRDYAPLLSLALRRRPLYPHFLQRVALRPLAA